MAREVLTLSTLDCATVLGVLGASIDLAVAEARARGEEEVLLKSPGGRKFGVSPNEAEAASGELETAAALIRRFFSLRPTVAVGKGR